MRSLKTPDTTKNQYVAIATMVIGVLTSMGVPLSEANTNRIYGAAVALSVGLMVSDAIIRFGRAMMAGKKIDNIDLGLDEPED